MKSILGWMWFPLPANLAVLVYDTALDLERVHEPLALRTSPPMRVQRRQQRLFRGRRHAADDSALDEATRVKALTLKTEWVALQSPPASSYKEEQEAEARRERLAERMAALLATI